MSGARKIFAVLLLAAASVLPAGAASYVEWNIDSSVINDVSIRDCFVLISSGGNLNAAHSATYCYETNPASQKALKLSQAMQEHSFPGVSSINTTNSANRLRVTYTCIDSLKLLYKDVAWEQFTGLQSIKSFDDDTVDCTSGDVLDFYDALNEGLTGWLPFFLLVIAVGMCVRLIYTGAGGA